MAGLIIAPRARVFHGHEWVYATEIKKSFGDPQPGDVVTLKDFRDRPLGSAIYNPLSQIVARRFSRRRQDLDLDFFTRRIRQAVEYRQRTGIDETLCRLVWSESDGIPGLIVDRYGEHLCVQTLTLAMDMRREIIRDALIALLAPKSIVLRNDSPFRKAEGMEPGIEMLHGDNPGPFLVESNGLDFEVDLFDGQKTGLYLDQLEAHSQVARRAEGRRVLDCFTNQGGFALACAGAGAAKVTAVDVSATACEAARHNARLNGLDIEVLEHNVSISSSTPRPSMISSSSIRRVSPATKRRSWTPCAATRRSICARSSCWRRAEFSPPSAARTTRPADCSWKTSPTRRWTRRNR